MLQLLAVPVAYCANFRAFYNSTSMYIRKYSFHPLNFNIKNNINKKKNRKKYFFQLFVNHFYCSQVNTYYFLSFSTKSMSYLHFYFTLELKKKEICTPIIHFNCQLISIKINITIQLRCTKVFFYSIRFDYAYMSLHIHDTTELTETNQCIIFFLF